MILDIAQLGQPVLREVASAVDPEQIADPEFQRFIDDMIETLEHSTGIGLAAPQVFRSTRVFLAGVLPGERRGGIGGVEVFINPRIVNPSEEKSSDWEGCLSFLELLVDVPRHKSLEVHYYDRTGEPKGLALRGFPARVIQHEYDHLDGILTIDRAKSTHDIIKASEVDAVRRARTLPTDIGPEGDSFIAREG
jgi:peptide deformylase